MSISKAIVPLFVFAFLTACESDSKSFAYPASQPLPPIPARVSPDPQRGTLTGKILNAPARWPGKTINIYAAEFQGDSEGKGFYFLDPSFHPQTALAVDGSFQMSNVRPGQYVLVVGPSPEDAIAIGEPGKPQIIQVSIGQTTDIGAIDIAP